MSPTTTRLVPDLRRAVAVAAGAVVALVGWTDIHLVGGVDLVVGSAPHARVVGPVDVAVAASVAGIAGWALLALIEHRIGAGRRAVRLWRGIGVLVLALSVVGPLTADAVASTRWSLVALHTSVGAALLAGLGATAAARCERHPHLSGDSRSARDWPLPTTERAIRNMPHH